MLLIDTIHEKHLLADIGHRLLSAGLKLIALIRGLLFPQPVMEKPGWVRCSERSWRRHSAFIMSQLEAVEFDSSND